MAQNNTIGSKLKFQDLPGVPDNQKLTAIEFNQLPAFQKVPVQAIAGAFTDTSIIIDGTKEYATTKVIAGLTHTITASDVDATPNVLSAEHRQGNNIKVRYQFDVDCTLTLTNFDDTGNNTGDITPILAGTYDLIFYAKARGVTLEIPQNTNNLVKVPNTWHVNTNGDDVNIGSDKFPFETIQAAHDAASPFDTIVIQNSDFAQPSSPATSITKDGLVIRGSATNSSTINGAWTLTAGVALRLQNLGMSTGLLFDSTGVFTLYVDSCSAKIKTGASRFMYLIGQNSSIIFGTPSNLYQLESYNCRCTGDINVGRRITFNNSSLVGNSISGIDSAQPMSMKDSSIEGNVTVTGDLDKVNSVITGTETVSGTTTSRQAKVFDDSVEFKDGIDITETPGSGANGVRFNGDTKIYEFAANNLKIAIGGTDVWSIFSTFFTGNIFGSGTLASTAPGPTVANHTFNGDLDLGLGRASANVMTDIAGGIEIARIEVGNYTHKTAVSREQTAEPVDPDDGESVQWTHDGSGGTYGIGDIVTKSTVGVTTKAQIDFDYSAL